VFLGNGVLAVVPARGGSRGIPRKNLARLRGRSLVGHAALLLGELNWLDAAILSTDDEEIADEGVRQGLWVPALRPTELATDASESAPMWRHAWLMAEEYLAETFDVSVLIEPTCPLRRPEDIERCLTAMIQGGHAAGATVSRTPSQFTPHKTVVMDDCGVLHSFLPAEQSPTRRQEIPEQYNRNGACYAARRDTVVERLLIAQEDCVGVTVDRPLVNIDEPFDLEYAAWLMNRQLGTDHEP